MAGMPPIRLYVFCDAEEKIRRDKIAYVEGRIDLTEFERRVALAIIEDDQNELRRLHGMRD